MEKSYKNEQDRIEKNAAEDMFEMEWKHIMYMYPDHRGNFTYHRFNKQALHKAFSTLFKEQFINIYIMTYDHVMDQFMLSNNSALVWKYKDKNKFYNVNSVMNVDFKEILHKKLNISLKKMKKE